MVFQWRAGKAPVFPRIQHLVSSDQVACVTQCIPCVSGVLPATLWELSHGEGSSWPFSACCDCQHPWDQLVWCEKEVSISSHSWQSWGAIPNQQAYRWAKCRKQRKKKTKGTARFWVWVKRGSGLHHWDGRAEAAEKLAVYEAWTLKMKSERRQG